MTQSGVDRRAFGLGALAAVSAGSASAAQQGGARPRARTRQGQVEGFRRNGAEIYLGLPYGASTEGERRFLPPEPPAPWQGIRDASKLGQRAPQAGNPIYINAQLGTYMPGGRAQELIDLKEPMGEDCLVLNVLTPKADNKARPVLFYAHGGGFANGSGAVHTLGEHLVTEEDVVLVTINHRLSGLGFLYFGGISSRYQNGNPGMLDIVAALKWVRDNIAAFGGDPKKVTIFGESGGGGKVSLLMAMPQAKGLFRAAIIQSAGPSNPSAPEGATQAARTLLDRLSIDPSNLAPLHTLPLSAFGNLAGGPVADGRTLTASPWGAGAPDTAATVPLIVGYCADEATLFTGGSDATLFSLDWPTASARLASLTRRSEAEIAPAFAAYRRVYPSATPSNIFFRMMSISTLGRGGRQIADAKARQPAPVYYYRMEYDTGIPLGLRAFHTCELPLTCRMVAQPRAEGLSRQLAGAWAAFARTGGDPNHRGMPRWGRYRPGGQGPIMIFDINSKVGVDPEEEAQTLWRSILAAPTSAPAVPAGGGRG